VIAAHLPVQEWPEKRLAIVAVDAETGSRIAFAAGSGVPLLDAVTASGALPGIYPLVTIEGRATPTVAPTRCTAPTSPPAMTW
jgi:NTE family protein